MAIGDSHTYGYNVSWEDAWPYQLSRSLNKSVYNLGVGGYGIFHYLFLAKEALKHKPEYVILALYVPNDIELSACKSVSSSYYQELLKQRIVATECPVQPQIIKAKPTNKPKRKFSFTRNSALKSAIKQVKIKYIKPKIEKYIYKEDYFDIGGNFTKKERVFYHYRQTDLTKKRVKSNFDASKIIISMMNEEFRSKGVNFGIIVIPSKALVIEDWALNKGEKIPKDFSVEPEKNLINNYLLFFKENQIPNIYSLPFIRKAFSIAVEKNEDLYPFEDDHPLAKGYESYSRAAEALIWNISRHEE